MSPKGKIQAVYPEGHSSVYNYVCDGEGGLFSVPVEWRYHRDILGREGGILGRERGKEIQGYETSVLIHRENRLMFVAIISALLNRLVAPR